MDIQNYYNVLKEKICTFFKSDKKMSIIFLIGIFGILIIFFSSGFTKESYNADLNSSELKFSSEKYVAQLEAKILDMVSEIEGAGKSKVVITLESGVEYVYAEESKQNTDSTQNITGSDSKKIQTKDNYEKKLILVDGQNGSKEALITKQLEPVIKGVVIVCEGADNLTVQNRIIDAVTTVLDILSTKVCITKLS